MEPEQYPSYLPSSQSGSGQRCRRRKTGDNASSHEYKDAFIQDLEFIDIFHDVMGRGCWKTVWFQPLRHEANILNTEARGLAWSVEHLLRSNCCIQKRLLCFSDNLPLVLSATIGRGRSHHLAKPLRKLAALSLATGSKVHVRWVASEQKCNGKVKLLRSTRRA